MARVWVFVLVAFLCVQAAIIYAEKAQDTDKRLTVVLAEGWKAAPDPQKPISLMLRSSAAPGANLNVIPEYNVGISLDDYEKLNETNTSHDPDLSDFIILNRSDTLVGGVPAKSWTYTAKVGKDKTPIKCKATFAIKDNSGYVITCGASESGFESQQEAFDSMLSSITWNKIPVVKKPASIGKPIRISDKSKTISVLMPAGWKNDLNPSQGALLLLSGPPATSSVSALSEKVGKMSLADYEKASERNATGGTDAFTIISKSSVKLGGMRAKKWVYTADFGEQKVPLKCMVFLVVRNKTAYTITMGSVKSQFDEAQQIFNAVAKSVIWLK